VVEAIEDSCALREAEPRRQQARDALEYGDHPGIVECSRSASILQTPEISGDKDPTKIRRTMVARFNAQHSYHK